MRRNSGPTRRGFLRAGAVAAGTLALTGCDALSGTPWFRRVLASAENLTRGVQRAILSDSDLATEFTEADLSPAFRANGSTDPDTPDYRRMAAENFANWRLEVAGLVDKPGSHSLDDLRAMPSRTQITRHDCVEGWSCIGKWTGVPLGHVLDLAALKPEAKFIVFRCADNLGGGTGDSGLYYESLAIVDAYHPQTILAYEMNDAILPVPHGAPLRLRVERQLGYKMAKYLMRIEAVESLEGIAGGKGGFWEDRGYEWYAGI